MYKMDILHIVFLVLVGTFDIFTSSVTAQTTNSKKYKLCVPYEMVNDCNNLGRGDSEITCVRVMDSTDCALKLIRGEVDFGKFTAEQAIVASYFFTIDGPNKAVTIGETRNNEKLTDDFAFTAVAIARQKSIPSGNLAKETDLKLCHPGVGYKRSGWSDRVLKELDIAALESPSSEADRRCDEWRSELENEYVSIAKFWGPSCRPGEWSPDTKVDKNLKDLNPSLCERCTNQNACSWGAVENSDPHKAAAECLRRGGDVAYLDQTYATDFINLIQAGDQEWALVCQDLNLGKNTSSCHWSRQPWSNIAARAAISSTLSPKLADWLKPRSPRQLNDTDIEPRANNDVWIKALNNILVDESETYVALPEMMVKDYILRGRKLPSLQTEHVCNTPARWCTLEGAESEKCNWLATASLIAGVVPPISCLKSENIQACAALIVEHKADLTVSNIDDAHAASMWTPQNSPFEIRVEVNKYVETTSEKNHHIVAMVPVGSKIRNITDLRDKKACFPVIGGVAYGAFLNQAMETQELPRECPYPVAVDKYFDESCVPGASANASNPKGLCELCEARAESDKGNKCAANVGNLFYNDTGAMRCLHSGGGEVAFLNVGAAREVVEEGLIPGFNEADFRILCESKIPKEKIGFEGAEECAIAVVPPAVALCRAALEPHDWNDVHHILISVDYLFGQHEENHPDPSFHAFHPFNGTKGLIFPAGTVGLVNKDSKLPAAEGYMILQLGVAKPCGSSGYNVATSLSVSSLMLTIVAMLSVLYTTYVDLATSLR